ncbi:MAG: FAD-binding protein [Gammaproteobacteria bacterium]
MDRRRFLKGSTALAGAAAIGPWLSACTRAASGVLVNDIHSQLNATTVSDIVTPRSLDELVAAVRGLPRGDALAVAGGRHAMGGQQFATGSRLIQMDALNGVLRLDAERGLVDVEAGIQWPELIAGLHERQAGAARPWAIVQKQTGADRLSIGGALASNIHGRGLALKPMVGDVESFTLVAPDGSVIECSRDVNPELFRLAIGGYGLFGVIATARLRLTPRMKIERVVEVADIDTLPGRVADRVHDGYLYGDGQFDINPGADGFLRRCVFSTYRPAAPGAEIEPNQKQLAPEDWQRLLLMTHTDKASVFDVYADYYRSTSGQIYWSDTHQMSTYIDDYHPTIGAGTEMISEVYAPRARLGELMDRLREDFRRHAVDVIYGTVRFIERDDETFLPWARESYACVVLNFHVDHGAAGIDKARADFQRLIDHALAVDGSYFLTYHRWARRDQIEHAYPQFDAFLREKRAWDPDERFQSDWYRHYRRMFIG